MLLLLAEVDQYIIKVSSNEHPSVRLDHHCIFLHISGQRNHLGCELHRCDKASQHEPSALIKKVIAEIGYSFVDYLISEIKEALVVDKPILEAFNIFSMETQSEEYRREQSTSFAITMEIKSTTFTKVIQLQQRPSYQCWNKKLNFKISFVLLMKSSKN